MIRFRYHAVNVQGKTRSGVVRGHTHSDAEEKLRMAGWFATELQPLSSSVMWLTPLSSQEKALFLKQLASMVECGLPLAQSLKVLLPSQSHSFQSVLRRMLAQLQQGQQLSHAMVAEPACFNAMDVQTVQAGEMAGTLALSLRHLADSVDQTSRLRKQVLSALIYPVLVSVMALVVLGLIIAFVLPRFEAVFASLLQGQALPWYTLALFQVEQFLRSYGVVVLLILGLGVLILGLFFQLLPHQARRLALHLPLIGSLLHSWFATQFTHHFAMLLQAGVPLITALEHSADRSVVQPIVHALKQGALPSQALAKFPQAPDLLVQLALVGEQTGELAKMMTQASQILREHFQQRLLTLTRLLEPALILALALLVGVVMSALFVPLLSLISQMARA